MLWLPGIANLFAASNDRSFEACGACLFISLCYKSRLHGSLTRLLPIFDHPTSPPSPPRPPTLSICTRPTPPPECHYSSGPSLMPVAAICL